MDKPMNDQPFRVDNIATETLGMSFNVSPSPILFEDETVGDINVPTPSFNFTDPMDPEVCCDEPKECMCTFGCIGKFSTVNMSI